MAKWCEMGFTKKPWFTSRNPRPQSSGRHCWVNQGKTSESTPHRLGNWVRLQISWYVLTKVSLPESKKKSTPNLGCFPTATPSFSSAISALKPLIASSTVLAWPHELAGRSPKKMKPAQKPIFPYLPNFGRNLHTVCLTVFLSGHVSKYHGFGRKGLPYLFFQFLQQWLHFCRRHGP